MSRQSQDRVAEPVVEEKPELEERAPDTSYEKSNERVEVSPLEMKASVKIREGCFTARVSKRDNLDLDLREVKSDLNEDIEELLDGTKSDDPPRPLAKLNKIDIP